MVLALDKGFASCRSVAAARTLLFCLGLSVSALTLIAAAPSARAQDALAQQLGGKVRADAQMLLESRQITYDFDRDLIVASGKVQIFYDGYTVEADRIVYDRKNGKMSARGNVIMTEPDGNVVQSQELALSEDFANVFAETLQIDTPQRTRFLAERANRTDGNVTTFENGIYTVYTRPTNPPDKPPLWRIRAAKIIHNQQEKTIEYEDASFEFFGASVAYLPYFSMPDPTVKRKSGFLIPGGVTSNKLGVGVTIPYYWALSPNYDLTTTVSPMSTQGVLGDAAFRHRLSNGMYTVSAAGLIQSRPGEFEGTSGDRRFRGAINTTGSFQLSENWKYGWDITYKSDRSFFNDYSFVSFDDNDETSEVYLSGNTLRNGLSIRGYAFSLSQEDYTQTTSNPSAAFSPIGQSLQEKQPIVAPVIDYDYVFDDPIAGGELSLSSNFTSLTRSETDAFRPQGSTTDRFRGVDGTFSRFSVKSEWRRTFIDPIGQVFTPFAYVRGDLFFLASADKNVTALTDETFVGRAMPAAGLEYRYPFIATFDGGNQILEPIAQVIVRPNEQRIGELPNEDAQSLVFDATTLFDTDKFSGFDRAEGGSRLNVGLSYKLQLDEGYYLSTLFGRSYQIDGENSFAKPDIVGTSLNSGLATGKSDYVGSMYLDTYYGVKLGAQARLDDKDFSVRRFQAQATGTYGPVVSSLAYAFLGSQPDLGINDPREEIVGSASLRLEENWRIFGSMRYDIQNKDVVQNGLGVGYDDEGFSMSVSYAEDRSRNNGSDVDRMFYLRLGLRTIGSTQVSSGSLN
ncbi:LPS-assembly protein LptD [Labrenzia suaedae]|uniref:LPS-assembly protein LptD n=2 Tax=Roseibium litorale TaxID=2803841 RepID=A0ABR9CR03_9HYPH|nr:LPS-assembly protein LptD [Roseibium litorale]MBD8892707.1 LPS-assembly protein LptD [Roseibium litorale]